MNNLREEEFSLELGVNDTLFVCNDDWEEWDQEDIDDQDQETQNQLTNISENNIEEIDVINLYSGEFENLQDDHNIQEF